MNKIIKKIKAWHYRRMIIKAAHVLSILNNVLIYAGYDRHTRRRFWHSMSKGPEAVIRELNSIAKLLGPSDGGGYKRVG